MYFSHITKLNSLKSTLRLSKLKICEVVHHVTEPNVVKVVLVTKDNEKFLLYHQEFPRAHQAPKVKLAKDAVELELRDSTIVYSVVVLEEREDLNAANTHAVCQTMHDNFQETLLFCGQFVVLAFKIGTELNWDDQRCFFKV